MSVSKRQRLKRIRVQANDNLDNHLFDHFGSLPSSVITYYMLVRGVRSVVVCFEVINSTERRDPKILLLQHSDSRLSSAISATE